MAVLGLTKLEMLNQVLEAIGVGPASALPSAGSDTTSIYAQAEAVLDRVARRVLGQGWPCNTINGKSYTSSGTPSVITITDALRVNCTGPGRYKGKLSLQGDDVYIMDEGTTDFGAATTVILDVVLDLTDIEDASPDVKELIAAEAAKEFQRRRKGSRTQDGFLSEEVARADINADRLPPDKWNHRPLIMQQPQGEQRQQ